MKRLLFIRGMGGQVTKSYFTYKQEQLSLLLPDFDVEVAMLDGSARKKTWLPVLNDTNFQSFDLVLCYSSGVQAMLYMLGNGVKVKRVLMIAASIYAKGSKSEVETGWYDDDWNYEQVRMNAEQILICNSPNDPFCPLSEAEYMRSKLGCRLIVTQPIGHMSSLFSPVKLNILGEMEHNQDLQKIIHCFEW